MEFQSHFLQDDGEEKEREEELKEIKRGEIRSKYGEEGSSQPPNQQWQGKASPLGLWTFSST